jgi:DNA topoisomerase-2
VKKCTIVENVLQFAQFKQKQQLSRKGGSKKTRVSGIAKLDDANEAGGKNADKCTLILTEGDSAKTLAVSGLSVVGRDRYGVFPLKGKPLNVREATHSQIMNNAEFGQIMQILGLKPNHKYDSPKGLRYGRLMIMTDQVSPTPFISSL